MHAKRVTRFVTARAAATWMQSQLQFSECKSDVLVTDGRGKDTKRLGLLLSIVLFIICFVFVANRAVFLDCAPLFVLTGETLF